MARGVTAQTVVGTRVPDVRNGLRFDVETSAAVTSLAVGVVASDACVALNRFVADEAFIGAREFGACDRRGAVRAQRLPPQAHACGECARDSRGQHGDAARRSRAVGETIRFVVRQSIPPAPQPGDAGRRLSDADQNGRVRTGSAMNASPTRSLRLERTLFSRATPATRYAIVS
jgi:hypothetical protein